MLNCSRQERCKAPRLGRINHPVLLSRTTAPSTHQALRTAVGCTRLGALSQLRTQVRPYSCRSKAVLVLISALYQYGTSLSIERYPDRSKFSTKIRHILNLVPGYRYSCSTRYPGTAVPDRSTSQYKFGTRVQLQYLVPGYRVPGTSRSTSY